MMGSVSTPTESIAAILADPAKFAAKKDELDRIRDEGRAAQEALRAERTALEQEKSEFETAKRKAADDALAQAQKIAADRTANETRTKTLDHDSADLEQRKTKHAEAVAEHTEHLRTAQSELAQREQDVGRREHTAAEKEKELAKTAAELEQRIAKLRAAMS